jgi:hypothetical protein
MTASIAGTELAVRAVAGRPERGVAEEAPVVAAAKCARPKIKSDLELNCVLR